MTRERDIEQVLERWFSDGPVRMPDAFYSSVIDRVDSVPQRRLAGLTTRFMTMPSTLRFAAMAAAIVLAVGAVGAYSLVNTPGPGTGPSPGSGTPSASLPATVQPSPSPSAPPIADGTYTRPNAKVSEVTAAINADSKLTAAEKKWLIETAFAMKGGTTLRGWLTFDHGRLTEHQQVDDVANVGTEGSYTFPDDHTMVYTEDCACPPTIFTVIQTDTGFRLQIQNPPEKEVDLFPARYLWESDAFTRQP